MCAVAVFLCAFLGFHELMKEINNEDFTKNLKKLRMRLGISQESLAEILDTTHSTINRWESGQHSPNYKDFYKLMKIFKVSYEELVGIQNLSESLNVVPVSLKEALDVLTRETGIVIKLPKPLTLRQGDSALYGKIEKLNEREQRLLERTVDKMLDSPKNKKKAN